MNLTRRQLLGSAVAVGAAACLPAAAAAAIEPVRSVSIYSFSASKWDGATRWDWIIRYSVNDGEIQTKKCETGKLAVELDGGVWLEMNEQPGIACVGHDSPPDAPMEWMFDDKAAYAMPVPSFWKSLPMYRLDLEDAT